MQNIKRTKEKKKITLGRAICYFFLGGIIILPFLLKGSIDEGFRTLWNEREIPYDVSDLDIDFYQNLFISMRLQDQGLSQENFIVEWLNTNRESTYEEILKNIPDKDIVQYDYWDRHVFIPTIKYNPTKVRDFVFFNQIYQVYKTVKDGHSQSSYYEDVGKYVLLSRLTREIISNIGFAPISSDKKEYILMDVLSGSESILRQHAENFIMNAEFSKKPAMAEITNSLLFSILNNFLPCEQRRRLVDAVSLAIYVRDIYEKVHYSNEDVIELSKLIRKSKEQIYFLAERGCDD